MSTADLDLEVTVWLVMVEPGEVKPGEAKLGTRPRPGFQANECQRMAVRCRCGRSLHKHIECQHRYWLAVSRSVLQPAPIQDVCRRIKIWWGEFRCDDAVQNWDNRRKDVDTEIKM